MHRTLAVSGIFAIALLSGCHSRYVETTITNASTAAVSVVQVEYPSASFGVQTLAPGQVFHYRFKLYGSGPVKLSYFDAKSQEHHNTGPTLSEGDEGTLDITVTTTDHADFRARVHR
jgi:hypothetical protein